MGKVFWVGNCLGRLKGHLDRVPGTWLIRQFVGTLKGLCKVGGHAHNHENQQWAGTKSQELVISREEGREHGLPREHCRECLQWRSVAKTIMGLGNTSDRCGWSQATVWCSLGPQVFFISDLPPFQPYYEHTHMHTHTHTQLQILSWWCLPFPDLFLLVWTQLGLAVSSLSCTFTSSYQRLVGTWVMETHPSPLLLPQEPYEA